MRRLIAVALLACTVSPGLSERYVTVEQLRQIVRNAQAAGKRDPDIALMIGDLELMERFDPTDFEDDPDSLAAGALRIHSALSAFRKPGRDAMPTAPAPSPGASEEILQRARAYTVKYIRTLPDFVCTRTTLRYDDLWRPVGRRFSAGDLRRYDAVSSELSYSHGNESDAPRIVESSPCGGVPPGLTSYGEFGSIISALFAATSNTQFTFSRWETLNGSLSAVFAYSVDRTRSAYKLTWCCYGWHKAKRHESTQTAYHGEIAIQSDSGAIVRVTRLADPPGAFPTLQTDTMVEYGPVEFDGVSYLCPVRSVIVSEVKGSEPNMEWRIHYLNEMRFTGYRKFVANSEFRFPAVPPSGAAPPLRANSQPRTSAPSWSAGECPEAPAFVPTTQPIPPPPPLKLARARPPQAEKLLRLRFSPDGQHVLAQDAYGISVLSVRPFEVRFRVPVDNGSLAEFTPDSREIVFISLLPQTAPDRITVFKSSPRLERWRIASGQRAAVRELPLQSCTTAEVSPDGNVIACAEPGGALRLIDVVTGSAILKRERFSRKQTKYEIDDETPTVFDDRGKVNIAFSPDGRYVVASPIEAAGTPIAWNLRNREQIKLKGLLRDLRNASFAFTAPDRLILQREVFRGLYKGNERISRLFEFPSGKELLAPALPWGGLTRTADPNVIVVANEQNVAQAINLRSGETVDSETAMIDVFQNYQVIGRKNGEVDLYESGKGRLGNASNWALR